MKYNELHKSEQHSKRRGMKRTRVIIEGNEQEGYSAYIKNNVLPYGVIGTGKTGKDAIADFLDSYEEMKSFHKEKGIEFLESEFEFVYDLPSFLKGYAYAFTLAGLSRITGINQGQLSHYINGTSVPRRNSILKIQEGIRNFAIDLQSVNLL